LIDPIPAANEHKMVRRGDDDDDDEPNRTFDAKLDGRFKLQRRRWRTTPMRRDDMMMMMTTTTRRRRQHDDDDGRPSTVAFGFALHKHQTTGTEH
jgi:hypothetical protein